MKKFLFLLALVGMIFTACETGGELDENKNGNPTEQPDNGGNQGGDDNSGGGNQGGEEGGGDDIPADKTQAIKFQDENTKLLCTLHWDENEDGELSYEEAAAVTDLGTAFKGSSILALTELKYFTSLEKIANSAFEGCASLVKITLPEQITSVGTSAFNGCTNLKKITIPNAVTWIGDDAFRDCTSLTSVTIGNSVTSIGDWAFSGCTSLTDTYVNITDLASYAISNNTYCFPGNKHLLVNDKEVTELVIPDSVTSIGSDAFIGCTSLTSITIPDSVTEIGSSAFKGCTGELIIDSNALGLYGGQFTKVVIGDSVTEIGGSAFRNCTSLTSVTIPDSVTSIGYSAFSNCTSLENVTIPDSVTTIGDSAFEDCTSLTSVTIPDSVTKIGYSAFDDCTGELIIDSKIIETDYSIDNYPTHHSNGWLYGAKFTKLTIGNSVTKIGSITFYNCALLTSITLPDSVTSIGGNAFNNCTSLTSITIPDSVTSIGGGVFSGCTSLKAFYGKFVSADNRCLIINGKLESFAPAGLAEYTIPDSVTVINGAFFKCTSLTSVTIGNSVTTIGGSAFRGCTSLTSVTIPNSVTEIGDSAFYNCKSLTSVTIPDSVTEIGKWAFRDCISLTSVYCKPTTPPTGDSDMFSSNASGRKIYVPIGSGEAYKTAEYWSDYANYIVGYDF